MVPRAAFPDRTPGEMHCVLISGWILIWSLRAVLDMSTLEAETVPIVLSGAILLYLT